MLLALTALSLAKPERAFTSAEVCASAVMIIFGLELSTYSGVRDGYPASADVATASAMFSSPSDFKIAPINVELVID